MHKCIKINQNIRLLILTVCLILCRFVTVHAQNFPVQSNVQIVPPYSLYLKDYSLPDFDRFSAQVLLKDLSRPELKVRFKLIIEGAGITIQTSPNYFPPPVFLEGGVPQRITGYDLRDYFNPNNLNFQGISKSKFLRSGRLPEGLYRITLQVLEYNRGAIVSNNGTATAWMLLNQPPLINLPQNNAKVKPIEPQNLMFQWTPRHLSSPNSAFDTEYKFVLVELMDGRNPNDAIVSMRPLYEVTTTNTSVFYGPSEPLLTRGNKYAFRVQARDVNGRDLFVNDGYSAVFVFTYGETCTPPTNIKVENINPKRVKVTWDAASSHTGFKIKYRFEADKQGTWINKEVQKESIELTDLEPDTSYVLEVIPICNGFEGEASGQEIFKTDSLQVTTFECGAPPGTFTLDNKNPLKELKVGDIVYAGDFEVKVTKVSGADGTFTGTGNIVIPMLQQIRTGVVFKEVTINEEYRMIKGEMDVRGAAVQVLSDEAVAKLNDIMAEIDGAFDKADQLLDKLDEITNAMEQLEALLEQMLRYLPDDIFKELEKNQRRLREAKKEKKAVMDNPNATEKQKKVAKDKLQKARKNTRDSWKKAGKYMAKAAIKVIKIIWEAINQIKKETDITLARKEFNIANEALIKSTFDDQGLERPTEQSKPIENTNIIIFNTEEVTEPKPLEYGKKVKAYHNKKHSLVIKELVVLFIKFYDSDAKVQEAFKNDSIMKGKELIHNIMIQLKEKVKEQKIIENTKNYMLDTIKKLADKIMSR